MSESTETRVTEWLAAQKDAMVDLLREVVDIDSGSYDKSGWMRSARASSASSPSTTSLLARAP